MLIKRIELIDFFRIYGNVEILFSQNPNKNVTVIKGDNGMGKTTLLGAFNWAFYGDVSDPLFIEEMLNKRARNEMKPGEIRTASVTVDLIDKSNEYAFRRSQGFKKNALGSIVLAGEPQLFIVNKTDHKPIEDSLFFENFIPEELRGFFFFDGERIDRLAKIDGKKEIKKAILDVLGLTNLEQINDNLESVKKDFNTEMKKKAKDKDAKELNEQFEVFSAELENVRQVAKQENDKLNKAKKTKADCDKYLEEHNIEKIRLLKKERELLEKEKASIEGESGLKKFEQKKILSYMSKNFKIFLISKYFKQIHELLEEKRKKKELPSDIKEAFVKDLLDSEICICGRSILQGTPEYANLTELLKTAGREELDSSYIKLSAFINSNATRETVETFYSTIYSFKDTMLNYDERLEEIKKQLKKFGDTLKNSDDDMIAAKESERQKAEEIIEETTKKIGVREDHINALVEKLKMLTGKIQKMAGKDKEADMYARCFEMTDRLLQLNDEIREHFIRTTQEDMDNKLKDVFKKMAAKQDREPVLTSDFELKIVNRFTKAPQGLSTGEGQMTSLSFIGALVSYAKEKPTMQLISDFAGGDYPIVMDSPFGNLDSEHKSNIASGIPFLASQVIVIVSDEQWKGNVEVNMFERVGKLYEMIDGETNQPDTEYTVLKEVK